MLKKTLAALMCLIVILTSISVVADEKNEETFTLIEKTKWEKNYTPVTIDGFDGVLFTFIDEASNPQFRVYGKKGKKKGYFKVDVTLDEDGKAVVKIDEDGEVYRDRIGKIAKLIKVTDTNVPADYKIPDGFKKNRSDYDIVMTNKFGVKEYYVYGSFNGDVFGWVKADRRGKPEYDTMLYDLTGYENKALPDGSKKTKMPEEIKKGYAQTVIIPFDNGKILTAKTAFPEFPAELDIKQEEKKEDTVLAESDESVQPSEPVEETKKVEIEEKEEEKVTEEKEPEPEVNQQEEIPVKDEKEKEKADEPEVKNGTYKEIIEEPIPYSTKYQKNKAMFITEPERVTQTGVDGIKEVTYKVTYKDGIETDRKKDKEKTTLKPVPEIIEKGSKDPYDEYILCKNVIISMETNTKAYTEEGTIELSFKKQVIGKDKSGNYNTKLYVTKIDGEQETEILVKKIKNIGSTIKIGIKELIKEGINLDGEYMLRAEIVKDNDLVSVGTNIYVLKPGVTEKTLSAKTIKTEYYEEATAFEIEKEKDETRFTDDEAIVIKEGKQGRRMGVYENLYVDGAMPKHELIRSITLEAPVNQVESVGSKEHEITTRTEYLRFTIARTVEYVEDPTVPKGEEIVVEEGKDGIRMVTYEITLQEGVEVSRKNIAEEIQEEMKPCIIKRNTEGK